MDVESLVTAGYVLDETDMVVGRWTDEGLFVNGTFDEGVFRPRNKNQPIVTGAGYDETRIQKMLDTPRYKRVVPPSTKGISYE